MYILGSLDLRNEPEMQQNPGWVKERGERNLLLPNKAIWRKGGIEYECLSVWGDGVKVTGHRLIAGSQANS